MGAARLAPAVHLPAEVADPRPRKEHVLPAEVLDRSVQLADAITQLVPSLDDMIDPATAEEDEPVRQPGRPIEGRLARPTKPYRDRVRRFRHQGRSVHSVEAAGEVDDGFRE